MTVTLHHGDCLEYMRGMADKSVDAVITDPPYGINENHEKVLSRSNLARAIDYGSFEWDKSKIEKNKVDEILRISYSQVIWGGNYYADLLPSSSCWLVWDKDNGANDFADCELAWTSYKTSVRKFRWRWAGFLKEKPEKRFHPTQKLLALMSWVIRNYTKEGDTIFDPFMGSGTTGVAAVQLGRNFIGCEINAEYFAIAEKRIRQAQEARQLELV